MNVTVIVNGGGNRNEGGVYPVPVPVYPTYGSVCRSGSWFCHTGNYLLGSACQCYNIYGGFRFQVVSPLGKKTRSNL